MLKLDDMTCEECGRRGCSSWSFTEGARCIDHSSYVGPRREEAQRLANIKIAKKYKEELKTDGQSPAIRRYMLEFIEKWLPSLRNPLQKLKSLNIPVPGAT